MKLSTGFVGQYLLSFGACQDHFLRARRRRGQGFPVASEGKSLRPLTAKSSGETDADFDGCAGTGKASSSAGRSMWAGRQGPTPHGPT